MIVLTIYGLQLSIRDDTGLPLPPSLTMAMQQQMTYEHVKYSRSKGYDHTTGSGATVEVEHRSMFVGNDTTLITGRGMLSRVSRICESAGISFRVEDKTPASLRAGCYVPNWENLNDFEFRPRQRECLQAISENMGGIIDAAAGFGKTYMFPPICRLYPAATVHIVSDRVDNAKDIQANLARYCSVIGRIGGDGPNFVGPRITVFTIDSVHKAKGLDPDIVLVDEPHSMMSDHRARQLSTVYRTGRVFGFSATTEHRMDNAHRQLELFFGPTIFKLANPEAVGLGLIVQTKIEWIPIDLGHNPVSGVSNPTVRQRRGIWRNEGRNAQIAAYYREHDADQPSVLMLTNTVEHAARMWRHLPEFQLCYGHGSGDKVEKLKSQGILPPDTPVMTPALRDSMRHAFRAGEITRVIATDVWAQGVSFDSLPVVYRLDARESAVLDLQAPQRASRISDGKIEGRVVDCVDLWDKGFYRKSQTRRSHYKKSGFSESGWVPREGS